MAGWHLLCGDVGSGRHRPTPCCCLYSRAHFGLQRFACCSGGFRFIDPPVWPEAVGQGPTPGGVPCSGCRGAVFVSRGAWLGRLGCLQTRLGICWNVVWVVTCVFCLLGCWIAALASADRCGHAVMDRWIDGVHQSVGLFIRSLACNRSNFQEFGSSCETIAALAFSPKGCRGCWLIGLRQVQVRRSGYQACC